MRGNCARYVLYQRRIYFHLKKKENFPGSMQDWHQGCRNDRTLVAFVLLRVTSSRRDEMEMCYYL